MKKPRVVFPFTEAGMGHIMPLRSIADNFEKKYGDRVEVVRSAFFSETNNPALIKFEDKMCEFVKSQNKNTKFGFLTTFVMDLLGVRFCSWYVMKTYVRGAYKAAVEHMRELQPDMVVTSHWATNYYVATTPQLNCLSVMYCPDAHINPLFAYKTDLTMVSMKTGYDKAKAKYKRYNDDNLKLVPFCIRPEAYGVPKDKAGNRKALGLPEDKFTIVLAEGGYGIGKMKDVCEEVIRRNLDVTLVPVCGKNEQLYEYFKSLKVGDKTVFKPQGFCTQMLEFIASADLFCGKSGNIIAEPTFFGVPSIITKHATNIEKIIASYYVDEIGCAINLFKTDKIVDKIEQFLNNPEELKTLANNAKKNENNYGSEKTADYIFELLCKKFPHLKDKE